MKELIEREAVVRWLRKQAALGDLALLRAVIGSKEERDLAAGIVVLTRATDAIERGDHHKGAPDE
jgi:hypothetical protein